MKSALVTMLIFTVLVAGITMAYKSAQSLQFIKPGSGLSLQTIGLSGGSSSGQGVWRYAIASGTWQQEKNVTGGSLTSAHVFEFVHDPGNPQNAYAATSSGLYRYEGSRNSWAYLAGGLPNNTQVLSVSVNAQNNSHLFISTLRSNGKSEIWRSLDAGKTFTMVYETSSQTQKIVDVADDWYNPQRVFALTDRGAFLRSDDEGLSWRMSFDLKRAGFTRLVMDPNDSRILYALHPSVGMLQTTDSGGTWESDEGAFANLPLEAKIINGLSAVQGAPGRLYLATNYGILRSENRGKSFTVVHSLVAENTVPIQTIESGKDSQTLFMATGSTLYESRDAGKTWKSHAAQDGQAITTFIYLGTPDEKIFTGS